MFRFYWFRGIMRGFGARFTGMMGFPGYAVMWGRFSFMDGIVGLALGVLMIVGAIMLYNRPQRHTSWGTVIVILSVLSFFGRAMGGFGIGLILGLVGGLLAITWKPTQTQPKT
jgi:multisubunit Na+/H+ antiporter MnhF subunit